jgi:hypothetical protein
MPAAPDNRALLTFCAVPSLTVEIFLPLATRLRRAVVEANSAKQLRLRKGGNR